MRVVLARSYGVCSESAPVRYSAELQLETSRGVTPAILGAACGWWNKSRLGKDDRSTSRGGCYGNLLCRFLLDAEETCDPGVALMKYSFGIYVPLLTYLTTTPASWSAQREDSKYFRQFQEFARGRWLLLFSGNYGSILSIFRSNYLTPNIRNIIVLGRTDPQNS